MEKTVTKVINWAKERCLNNAENQIFKMFEEFGEMNGEILNVLREKPGAKEKLALEIGDKCVTLAISADQTGCQLDFSKVDFNRFTSHRKILGIVSNLMYYSSVIGQNIADNNPVFSSDYITCFVRLHQIARKFNLDLKACFEAAYEKISTRETVTINGNAIQLQKV